MRTHSVFAVAFSLPVAAQLPSLGCFSATAPTGTLSIRFPHTMQQPNTSQHGEQLQSRSASWPCKPVHDQQRDFCQKDSPNLFSKGCFSQPGSSVSAYSNDMISSTEGNVQLEESALQCEEHPFLSSPQDSDTSAFSHQDVSRYYSPMLPLPSPTLPLPRHAPSPPRQYVPIFEVSGQPSIAEVPTDCIWATMSVAGSGKHYCSLNKSV